MKSPTESPKVTFFPPLHHQRRIWILDILRRERLTQILDIGCGDGALLTTLCQPAPWLAPNHFQDADQELSALFWNIGLSEQDTPDLHATCVAGLDISVAELEVAAQYTSPAAINPLYTRWETLNVELWQGSVDVVNPAFVDVQCVVASELIEHLTDDILVKVAPVVLGVYRPRMFLVTTPSYTFNRRWSPPGTADPQGYPDPTGRTDRVFRHADHKFEWTVDEFVRWCEDIARQWGYAVETDTIGVPREQDPWGRDGVLGGASQVASFRRLDDRLSRATREHGARTARHTIKEPHILVTKYCHEAHPCSGRPVDMREIEEAVILKFRQWEETILRVQELWFADNLAVLCGGSMEVLLNVAERSAVLELQQIAGQRQANWRIQFAGGLTDPSPLQTTPTETEGAMCEDDELDYSAGDGSFDSGIDMGMSHDGRSWCSEGATWTPFNGGEDNWTTKGNESWEWTDTSRSEWATTV